jgi:mannose-6-phosphate isomerase-like protein (cupin superfamily)
MKLSIVLLGVVLTRVVMIAQTAVLVSEEPRHHVQFENASVRVFDVVVPPGEATLFHVHAKDYAFVVLGEAVLKTQLLGKEEQDLKVMNGDVGFTRATITHRVRNVGSTPFHNLTIELLASPSVSSNAALALVGKSQTLVMENDRIRAVRLKLKPGESTGLHTHSLPSLGLPITTGTILVTTPGKEDEKRELTPGLFSWRPGALTHSITNIGKTDYEAIDIEVK